MNAILIYWSYVVPSNIKMDFNAGGCGLMEWIDLGQDRDRWWTLVNAVMNFWVP
jgi:hypothetical protein